MTSKFVAERAISPGGGAVLYVVIDDRYELHAEASAYLAWLRSSGRSPNTERIYAGRLALFLTYCAEFRLDWRELTIEDLSRFLSALVPRQFRPAYGTKMHRSNKTANAIFTAVGAFLKFSVTRGWVESETVDALSNPRFLRVAPPGYDFGEGEQFRVVGSRALKLTECEAAPQWLTDDQISEVVQALPRLRDRFLAMMVAESGVRIGEALGLRREDMHLLSSSKALNCAIEGPHLHVRRRLNANGALAKCRFPRAIPVTQPLVDVYADYQYERSSAGGAEVSDFVFVNLYRPPVGEPLRYNNVKKMFDRVSDDVGFRVRPHMLRHSAATRWVAGDTPRDVVQALLGHVSPTSMQVYLHPTDAAKRRAVEQFATGSEQR